VRDVTRCQSHLSKVFKCTLQTKIATVLEEALAMPRQNYNVYLCGKRLLMDQTLGEAKVRPLQTLTVSLPLAGGSEVTGLLSAEAFGISDQP